MDAAVASAVAQTKFEPCVNVSFSIQGSTLPADHGYLLYSAISRSVSALHSKDWLAIELISGFPAGRGLITLGTQASGLHSGFNSKLGSPNSKLKLRIPAEHYRDVLLVAGKRLDIGGHQIRLGLPVARTLEPAPSLYARVVTIKKFTEPEPFLEAVKRKLDQFGIKGRVELPLDVAQTVSLRAPDDSKLKTENSKLNSVPRFAAASSPSMANPSSASRLPCIAQVVSIA